MAGRDKAAAAEYQKGWYGRNHIHKSSPEERARRAENRRTQFVAYGNAIVGVRKKGDKARLPSGAWYGGMFPMGGPVKQEEVLWSQAR
jgi:hypothetical protein